MGIFLVLDALLRYLELIHKHKSPMLDDVQSRREELGSPSNVAVALVDRPHRYDRSEFAEQADIVQGVEVGIYRTQLLLACVGLLSSRQCDYLRNQIPTAVQGGVGLEQALYNLALLWLREVFLDHKDHEAIELAGDERAQRNLGKLFDAQATQEAKDQLASVGIREPR